jgi:hypothetical protein
MTKTKSKFSLWQLARGPLMPCYLTDTGLYRLAFETGLTGSAPLDEPSWIVVVHRGGYSETIRAFPAIERADLDALLALELGNDARIRYSVSLVDQSIDATRSYVTVWQLNADIDLKGRLWIPETAAIATGLEVGSIARYTSFTSDQQQIWLARSARGVVSTPRSSRIDTVSSFAIGASLPVPAAEHVMTTEELPLRIADGLGRFTPKQWLDFMPRVNWSQVLQTTLIKSIPLALVLAAYLGASSVYLWWSNSQLEARLGGANTDVSEILEERSRYESNLDSLVALHEWLEGQYPAADVWRVISPLLETVQFEAVRREYRRVVITGTAPKATDVLEALVAHPDVIDARFDQATSQRSNRDSFVISFMVAPAEVSP